MNAKQLIEQVNECRQNNWQNSDLGNNSEEMLEKIAGHFENCEECRKEFDAQEYSEETLIDFEDELSGTELSDWVCLQFIDMTQVQKIIENILFEEMEKDGAVTEIEQVIQEIEVKGYKYEISVRVSRVMEDDEVKDATDESSEYKYTTVGQLRNIGENIELGEERLDDEKEVRLVSVAKTNDGEILVQVDVLDSYGTWGAHTDFDITLGMEDKKFFDIESGEPFETYSGYGMLLTKEEWKKL